MATLEERFHSKYAVDREAGCWKWIGGIETMGYGSFWFDGRMQRAHRLAWLIFKGEVPEGMCVLHHCDNRRCVNPEHLFLGTRTDNMQDMHGKRRWVRHHDQRGEKNHSARFTAEQIVKIRTEYAAEPTYATLERLGKQHQTHTEYIRNIVTRKVWAHLEGRS